MTDWLPSTVGIDLTWLVVDYKIIRDDKWIDIVTYQHYYYYGLNTFPDLDSIPVLCRNREQESESKVCTMGTCSA